MGLFYKTGSDFAGDVKRQIKAVRKAKPPRGPTVNGPRRIVAGTV